MPRIKKDSKINNNIETLINHEQNIKENKNGSSFFVICSQCQKERVIVK